jgi:hypothetical protein
MASISYSLDVGADQSPDAITVGTLAVSALDIEVRVDLAANPTRDDVILALQAIIRKIEDQGAVQLGQV